MELVAKLAAAKSKEERDLLLKEIKGLQENSSIYLAKVTDPPVYKKEMYAVHIFKRMRQAIMALDADTPVALFMTDKKHYGISKEEVERIINTYAYNIDKSEYTASIHDCDDFAAEMKGFWEQAATSGFCVGYALSKTHAFNWFIDEEEEIWILEPQNGRIFKPYNGMNEMYNINRYWV